MTKKYTSKNPCGPLTKEECQVWVDALRSGKYEQCEGFLRTDSPNCGTRFCVLGVLEEAVGKARDDMDLQRLHDDVLPSYLQEELYEQNDADVSFLELADHIEAHLLPELPDEAP